MDLNFTPEEIAFRDEARQFFRTAIPESIRAKVRDLSLGGANLLVDRPFEAGQMLSVELPANKGDVRTVLACVVRVIPQEDGHWSLGCVFSRELNILGVYPAHPFRDSFA